MKRTTAITAALLSVLLIACGGSDSDSADHSGNTIEEINSSPTLSKEEFIEQADEICGEFDEKTAGLDADFESARSDNDAEAMADAYEGIADYAAGLTEDLRALEYDGEGSEVVDEYLGSLEKGVVMVGLVADSIRDEDISKANEYGEDIERLAERLEIDPSNSFGSLTTPVSALTSRPVRRAPRESRSSYP